MAPLGGGSLGQVALDAWCVWVTYEPTGEKYEWRGRIRDIASIGAFTRLTLEGDVVSTLLADIPSSYEIEDFDIDIGDMVFAHVSPSDVRPVRSLALPVPTRMEDEAKEEVNKTSVTIRKRNLLTGVRNFFSGILSGT